MAEKDTDPADTGPADNSAIRFGGEISVDAGTGKNACNALGLLFMQIHELYPAFLDFKILQKLSGKCFRVDYLYFQSFNQETALTAEDINLPMLVPGARTLLKTGTE